MGRPKPIRNTLSWVFIKPMQQPFRLTRGISSNIGSILQASRRGASRDRLKTPPIDMSMDAQTISRLDRWWQSLPVDTRHALLAGYDQWIVEQSIISEREPGPRQEKRFWSLSGSRSRREEALIKHKGIYHLWLSALAFGVIVVGVMYVTREPSIMFYLMAMCFFSLLVPDVVRQRLVRAQLLYGRRVSLRELFSPLPKELHVDEEHEARYQAALKKVMTGGALSINPIFAQFNEDVFGQTTQHSINPANIPHDGGDA